MELDPITKMMVAAKVQLILQKAKQERKPECYHAVCMYSCDACSNCKYDLDCHDNWLEYMRSKT